MQIVFRSLRGSANNSELFRGFIQFLHVNSRASCEYSLGPLPFLSFPINVTNRSVGRSVGRTNFLVSGPVRTHDHNFALPKIFTYFEMGPPLLQKEGSDDYLSLSFY
jgi:hypothetical protein